MLDGRPDLVDLGRVGRRAAHATEGDEGLGLGGVDQVAVDLGLVGPHDGLAGRQRRRVARLEAHVGLVDAEVGVVDPHAHQGDGARCW